MITTTIGEAFEINPKVKVSKGTVTPRVEMADVEPFTKYVHASHEIAYSGGAKFKHRDVLMARITPSLENGKTSVYVADQGKEDAPASGSTEFLVLRARPGITDPDYCYYLMTTVDIREFAIGTMTGSSGRQRVQTDSFSSYAIELPELANQRRIAETLSLLDDKIESNKAKIATIPQLIDAVVAKELSEDSKRIPVSDLAEFINGGAYTKGASGTGRMVIRIAELNSGPGASTVYSDRATPDEKTGYPGDILMSWSGSLGVYRWTSDEALINQHIFKVIPRDLPQWLVYERVRSAMPTFQAIAADKATTMGHINRQHLTDVTVPLPTEAAICSVSEVCEPLWDLWLSLARQNEALKQLRNTLLPELLSARISPDEIGNVLNSVEFA